MMDGEIFAKRVLQASTFAGRVNRCEITLYSSTVEHDSLKHSVTMDHLEWKDSDGNRWLQQLQSLVKSDGRLILVHTAGLWGNCQIRNTSAWAWRHDRDNVFQSLTVASFEQLLTGPGMINKMDSLGSGILRDTRRRRPRSFTF